MYSMVKVIRKVTSKFLAVFLNTEPEPALAEHSYFANNLFHLQRPASNVGSNMPEWNRFTRFLVRAKKCFGES